MTRTFSAFALSLLLTTMGCEWSGSSAAPPPDAVLAHKKIRQFFATLPNDFGSVPTAQRESLEKNLDRARGDCRKFLDTWGEDKGVKGQAGAEVQYIYGKLLFILNKVEQQKVMTEASSEGLKGKFLAQRIQERMAPYHKMTVDSLEASVAKLGKTHEFRSDTLLTLGQACTAAKQHERATAIYRQYLSEYGADPERHKETAQAVAALGGSLLEEGKFDEAIEPTKEAIKKFVDTPTYPYLTELLWKLFRAKGDLDGMAEAVETATEGLQEPSTQNHRREDTDDVRNPHRLQRLPPWLCPVRQG